jgi:hypothetical protein
VDESERNHSGCELTTAVHNNEERNSIVERNDRRFGARKKLSFMEKQS